MSNMINVTNCETGEEVLREMNEEELANLEAIKAAAIAQAQKDADLVEKKQNALAKLAALGLDQDDLKGLGFDVS